MAKKEDKRQKFTAQKKSKTPLFIGAGILTMAVILVSYLLLGEKNSAVESKAVASIGQTVKYSPNEQLQQTKVPSKVENGKVVVTTLSTLKKEKFIWTEYKANGRRVPLTAVVQPNGKVLVAVSICEPCNSETFHITGNQLICNACGTVWDLQTLKGINGGCQQYPPDALTYFLNGDNIVVDQAVLDFWKPRV